MLSHSRLCEQSANQSALPLRPSAIPFNLSTAFSPHPESPMKIEIVVDPARPAPLSLAARVAPAPAVVAAASGNPTRAAPGTRGRRGRGRGGARRLGERPTKSVADLDAEMEDYTSANQPAAAATTTA
ncbi:hypothetical protein AX16_005965 [Volvariella volvacea WC 439]|nr:hypothetical protein AX16_005965 [Volvariella volvacea WC 439]